MERAHRESSMSKLDYIYDAKRVANIHMELRSIIHKLNISAASFDVAVRKKKKDFQRIRNNHPSRTTYSNDMLTHGLMDAIIAPVIFSIFQQNTPSPLGNTNLSHLF